MRICMLILALFTMGILSAEQLTLTTPEGQITIEVTGMSSGSNISGAIIDNIADKLEILDNQYVSELNRLDKTRARNIINEIFALLATLPTDANVQIKQSTVSSTPDNASMNLNVSFNANSIIKEQPDVTPSEEPAPTKQAVNETRFAAMLKQVNAESFADDKMNVINTITRKHYFTVEQLIRLVSVFTFADDKVDVVRKVYPKVVDTENSFHLLSAFTYSDDKNRVQQIIDEFE
ncbi:MAG: DUF4476 domain-containing protein [Candidatus Cloacimonetes bacterium]|nr:DUF4476 domain-containing protein [Candidatus Cloacimonadota bacterium]